MVFIRQRKTVGQIKEDMDIYRILSVVLIPLESDSEVMLEACVKCQDHGKSVSESSSGATSVSPSHGPSPTESTTSGIDPPLFKVKVLPPAETCPKKSEK
jgi:hypothetical protein